VTTRQQLFDHIHQWVGPVAGVFDCGDVGGVHIEVAHAPPTDDKPFHVLATIGVSERPQAVPEDADVSARIEMVMGLVSDWPARDRELTDLWPVQLLSALGRFPHRGEDTWLGVGHTVPNGSPPEPYVPDGPSGAILLPPVAMPPEFERAEVDFGGGPETVQILAVVPLYADEIQYKVQNGARALIERFDAHGLNEVYGPGRRKVAGGLFELL
jgi:hypothetical protein